MRTLAIVTITAAAFVFAGFASPHSVRGRVASARAFKCGAERWPVKTLADPGAAHVRKTAVPSTVDALARLDLAVGIGGARGLGAELERVKVNAKLDGIKVESDGDFHLVIKDPTTAMRMIVEFPDKRCTHGAAPKLRAKMENARNAVLKACAFSPTMGFHPLAGEVTVTGVPFFDFLHRQTGHAPNGIELHPVLRFRGHCTG